VSNAELAARLAADGIETSDEWIVERTGIRFRHFAEPDVTCSDLGVEAARRALAAADCDPQAIDLIIVATSTPDMVFPSAACMVQEKLGIHGCAAFDVQAVCSGFVYALSVADSMIKTGLASKALVDRLEVFSRILDFSDRTTCVLFGDGAGAGRPRGERGARHPRERAACRRSPCRHPVRAGHGLGRQGARRSAAEDGRPGGVQARRLGARHRRPLGAGQGRPRPRPTSTG
jgi:predicted naringenin-chalcone synthase